MLTAAALLVAWVADLGAVRLAAACAALAFGLVAASYAGGGPRLLLKHSTGRRRLWAWPLYWPYFLLNDLSFLLYRISERRPPFEQVAPNLFLGRRLTAGEVRRSAAPRWSAVLDLAAEFPEAGPLRTSCAYRSWPVLDATAPPPQELSAAVAWLAERVAEGPVYVHCALGHGRSATVVIAYLLASGQAGTIGEGLELVRSKRAGIGLNPLQMAALRRFARILAGETVERSIPADPPAAGG